MTVKQGFIAIAAALLAVVGLLIFTIVRVNTAQANQKEQEVRLEAVEEKSEGLAAAMEELKMADTPSDEPLPSPEPIVYVVSPIAQYDAFATEAAPYFALPTPDSESIGTLEAGANMVVSGICGDYYFVTLPDGVTCYVAQGVVAQVIPPTPEPVQESVPEVTPEPTPEVPPMPEQPVATE